MGNIQPVQELQNLFVEPLAFHHGFQRFGIVSVPFFKNQQVGIVEMRGTEAHQVDGRFFHQPHNGIQVVHFVAGIGIEEYFLFLGEDGGAEDEERYELEEEPHRCI